MKSILRLQGLLFAFYFLISPPMYGQSRLIGDQFTLSYTNFPGDLGVTFDPEEDRPRIPMDHGTLPGIVTFDGQEEVVGGMRVNERVVEFPGLPGGIPAEQAAGIDGETEFDLIDWENAGEVIEFSWDTVDGSYISSEALDHSFITITDLNWQNSDAGSVPAFYETGWYIYYTQDGQAVTGYETLLPQIGLLVGAHPFDESVEEVFYIAYSQSQVEDISLPYEGGVDFTFGTTQLDANASWLILAETMGLTDQNEGVNGLRLGVLVDPPSGEVVTLPGDFNADGALDSQDINALTQQSATMTNPPAYDLNDDSRVNDQDVKLWIRDLFGSWVGDADLDGQFNSTDLVSVLASGTYEQDVDSAWTSGDFDGSGRSNSSDLVAALADGGYELGPRSTVAAVPEPSSLVLLFIGVLAGLGCLRRS